MHGIFGAGKAMEVSFFLIEAAKMIAQIYMRPAHFIRINTIRDD